VRAGLDKAPPPPLAIAMPGPTGEANTLNLYPRGVVLCLGPDEAAARAQAELALAHRNAVLVVAPGAQRIATELGRDGAVIGGVDKRLAPAAIEAGLAVDAVLHWGEEAALKPWRQALAGREGPIVPLIASPGDADRLILERHVCIDTTASGGNAELLAGGAPAAPDSERGGQQYQQAAGDDHVGAEGVALVEPVRPLERPEIVIEQGGEDDEDDEPGGAERGPQPEDHHQARDRVHDEAGAHDQSRLRYATSGHVARRLVEMAQIAIGGMEEGAADQQAPQQHQERRQVRRHTRLHDVLSGRRLAALTTSAPVRHRLMPENGRRDNTRPAAATT